MRPDLRLLPRLPATILLADDVDQYLSGLERAVAGHAELELVASCEDGSAALDALLRLRPTLALIDVRMPGLHGSDVVRLAREELPHTTFVLMSSHDDVHDVAHRSGAALGVNKAVPRRLMLNLVLEAARAPGVVAHDLGAVSAS